ncbi:MAG: UbiA prenyltransferase family protein [Dysgonomonas mossii]|uniref:UbiA prenyltransferase family protein n=1 Tax=Dysgonomonas mossii TaxID=163665 RepID=UPI001DEBD195|nr:UbiA prenyltransferase family protein [Dysgonomonas mossii]MBS5797033.1 UbiA prenyltransferase family protein [Dysgonomonas mossii]MBS7111870.1 UbiA prenyltransferase family protein [Dysgonomonas mossii]
MNKVKHYLQLMRIHQWVKNFFIFLPLFFSFKMDHIPLLIADLWAFVGFCLIASSIYIINDWNDIATDRLHPEKRNRPLASGAINKKEALLMILSLVAVGVSVYIFVLGNYIALALLVSYFILNIFYSLRLKHIPVIDISIVAIGFVIRIFIGGVVTDTPLSRWIVVMTFLLAIFLALGKRRDDVVIYEETGDKVRKNVDGYNIPFLNVAIVVVAAVMMVAYIMYTISPEVTGRNGDNLYLTSFFVFVGLFRYLQIIFVEDKSGNPTLIFLKDNFIRIIIILWIISFFVVTKFFR